MEDSLRDFEDLVGVIPVYYVPEVFNEFSSVILIVDVISVFPDIEND